VVVVVVEERECLGVRGVVGNASESEREDESGGMVLKKGSGVFISLAPTFLFCASLTSDLPSQSNLQKSTRQGPSHRALPAVGPHVGPIADRDPSIHHLEASRKTHLS